MFDITLIHPIVNHFTIALFIIAILLDILGLITKKEYFHTTAWIDLIFAAISGVLSLITGLLAEANVPHVEAAHEIMKTHETLGYIILTSILVLFVWRLILKGKFPPKAMILYLLIGLGGIGVMIRSAFLGGEMVFVHGVAVKAVSVSPEEAGHHHEHESNEQAGEMDQHKSVQDSLKSIEEQKEVHEHEDGSAHVHDEKSQH
jgi:uncharacterized membrane protein